MIENAYTYQNIFDDRTFDCSKKMQWYFYILNEDMFMA